MRACARFFQSFLVFSLNLAEKTLMPSATLPTCCDITQSTVDLVRGARCAVRGVST